MGDSLITQLQLPSPLVELHDDRLAAAGITVLLKRDDLIHPELPGNKWRKLKYNIMKARELAQDTLLTFGGAYSNHIRATAVVGYYLGFRTIGVIRGEEHLPLNTTLRYAAAHGMQLIYLDRAMYRDKKSPEVVRRLRDRFGDFYLLPEGGSNVEALRGCVELPAELPERWDVLLCAVGTGGTLAGVAAGIEPNQAAIGIPVLKGGAFLEDEIEELQRQAYGHRVGNWRLECDYHFGGYAKRTAELSEFIDDFHGRHSLQLDWVYEAKMMYALFDQVKRGRFPSGTTVVALISGTGDIPRA